ncbi:MAG: hypothetical protein ABIY55_27215 [Kofleriaceae bacterium]
MSLAQMYDSTVERQLQYLLQQDQHVDIGSGPQPAHDHSSEDIG